MSFRVRPELKDEMDRVAAQSGRSVSQEIEIRLENSFRDQRLMIDTLALVHGRELAGLLLTLGRVMKDAGGHAGVRSTGKVEGADDWINNPAAFAEAAAAAARVLRALTPTIDPAATGVVDVNAAAGLGEQFAAGALEALRNGERGGGIGEWAAPVRAMLGPAAIARIPDEFDTVAVSLFEPSATVPSAIAIMGMGKRQKRTKK